MKSKAMQWGLYILVLLVLSAAGLSLMMKGGYEVVPAGIMKPSFFDKPEEIGAVVYRRFYSDVEQKKLVVFGIPPEPDAYRDIVRGFLSAAALEKRPFELVIAEERMTPLDLSGLPPIQVVNMSINDETQAAFVEAVHGARASGKRVLVYVPSVFSSHLLPRNPIQRYEKASNDPLFSITTGALALRPNQEYVVNPSCLGSQVDGMGLAPLGCAMMQASRGLYRKKVPQDRYVAFMNEPAQDDYLLLISSPGQDKAETPKPTPPAKPPSL